MFPVTEIRGHVRMHLLVTRANRSLSICHTQGNKSACSTTHDAQVIQRIAGSGYYAHSWRILPPSSISKEVRKNFEVVSHQMGSGMASQEVVKGCLKGSGMASQGAAKGCWKGLAMATLGEVKGCSKGLAVPSQEQLLVLLVLHIRSTFCQVHTQVYTQVIADDDYSSACQAPNELMQPTQPFPVSFLERVACTHEW